MIECDERRRNVSKVTRLTLWKQPRGRPRMEEDVDEGDVPFAPHPQRRYGWGPTG